MTEIVITEPGVYDIPDDVYHADPVPGGSLSSTGARRLLPPSCPALFRHEQDNPPGPKDHFDFGHAAHQMVLGTGPEIVVVDAKDWKTKAAQAERDAARARGAVPLLTAQHEQVKAMAHALGQHKVAAALLNPQRGRPEQSLFWIDEPTSMWRRARLDWLPTTMRGRLIVADYKSCVSAAPGALRRAMHAHGYHQQAAWYLDAVAALGYPGDAAFVFVCQEKTAPHLVTLVELDAEALAVGRVLNRRAIEVYAECSRTGHWPGYSHDIVHLSLPSWASTDLEASTS